MCIRSSTVCFFVEERTKVGMSIIQRAKKKQKNKKTKKNPSKKGKKPMSLYIGDKLSHLKVKLAGFSLIYEWVLILRV